MRNSALLYHGSGQQKMLASNDGLYTSYPQRQKHLSEEINNCLARLIKIMEELIKEEEEQLIVDASKVDVKSVEAALEAHPNPCLVLVPQWSSFQNPSFVVHPPPSYKSSSQQNIKKIDDLLNASSPLRSLEFSSLRYVGSTASAPIQQYINHGRQFRWVSDQVSVMDFRSQLPEISKEQLTGYKWISKVRAISTPFRYLLSHHNQDNWDKLPFHQGCLLSELHSSYRIVGLDPSSVFDPGIYNLYSDRQEWANCYQILFTDGVKELLLDRIKYTELGGDQNFMPELSYAPLNTLFPQLVGTVCNYPSVQPTKKLIYEDLDYVSFHGINIIYGWVGLYGEFFIHCLGATTRLGTQFQNMQLEGISAYTATPCLCKNYMLPQVFFIRARVGDFAYFHSKGSMEMTSTTDEVATTYFIPTESHLEVEHELNTAYISHYEWLMGAPPNSPHNNTWEIAWVMNERRMRFVFDPGSYYFNSSMGINQNMDPRTTVLIWNHLKGYMEVGFQTGQLQLLDEVTAMIKSTIHTTVTEFSDYILSLYSMDVIDTHHALIRLLGYASQFMSTYYNVFLLSVGCNEDVKYGHMKHLIPPCWIQSCNMSMDVMDISSIFSVCGKSTKVPYILNAETSGSPPSSRNSHSCSSYTIIVINCEDAIDYHILATDTLVWKELITSGNCLPPRAGHSTVNFGGFTDYQNLYRNLHVCDIDSGLWTKVMAIGDGPAARFSATGNSRGPTKAGVVVIMGEGSKHLEALEDMYLHTYIQKFSLRVFPCHGKRVHSFVTQHPWYGWMSSHCSMLIRTIDGSIEEWHIAMVMSNINRGITHCYQCEHLGMNNTSTNLSITADISLVQPLPMVLSYKEIGRWKGQKCNLPTLLPNFNAHVTFLGWLIHSKDSTNLLWDPRGRYFSTAERCVATDDGVFMLAIPSRIWVSRLLLYYETSWGYGRSIIEGSSTDFLPIWEFVTFPWDPGGWCCFKRALNLEDKVVFKDGGV